jgi:hypothetical protein
VNNRETLLDCITPPMIFSVLDGSMRVGDFQTEDVGGAALVVSEGGDERRRDKEVC